MEITFGCIKVEGKRELNLIVTCSASWKTLNKQTNCLCLFRIHWGGDKFKSILMPISMHLCVMMQSQVSQKEGLFTTATKTERNIIWHRISHRMVWHWRGLKDHLLPPYVVGGVATCQIWSNMALCTFTDEASTATPGILFYFYKLPITTAVDRGF